MILNCFLVWDSYEYRARGWGVTESKRKDRKHGGKKLPFLGGECVFGDRESDTRAKINTESSFDGVRDDHVSGSKASGANSHSEILDPYLMETKVAGTNPTENGVIGKCKCEFHSSFG